jgi:signal peptidase I
MTTVPFQAAVVETTKVHGESRSAIQSRGRREKRPGSSRGQLLLRLANILLVVACSCTAVVTIGNAMGWWRTDTVHTGSMRPGIQPGDVEILRSEPTDALVVGQIVAFQPPHDQFAVSHRVTAIRHHHGTWITTKGVANNASDPWGSVRIKSGSVWVVRGVIPHVGYLSVWARTPLPHLLLALTVILLLSGLALEAIWRQ